MSDTDGRNNNLLSDQLFPGLINDAQKNAAVRVREGLNLADLPIIERVAEAQIVPSSEFMGLFLASGGLPRPLNDEWLY